MRLTLDGPTFLALIDACDTAITAHEQHAKRCAELGLHPIAVSHRDRAERIRELLCLGQTTYASHGISDPPPAGHHASA